MEPRARATILIIDVLWLLAAPIPWACVTGILWVIAGVERSLEALGVAALLTALLAVVLWQWARPQSTSRAVELARAALLTLPLLQWPVVWTDAHGDLIVRGAPTLIASPVVAATVTTVAIVGPVLFWTRTTRPFTPWVRDTYHSPVR